MLRKILEDKKDFLETWVCFEPTVLDGLDEQYKGAQGHDETSRFIPYFFCDQRMISEEPLKDYETPGAGDYCLLEDHARRPSAACAHSFQSIERAMSMPNSIQRCVKPESRPIFLAWLNSLLGYSNNGELLEDTRTVVEGFGADGRSFLYLPSLHCPRQSGQDSRR